MNRKYRILCIAVCLLCLILLAVLTLLRVRPGHGIGIIGGAGMPTVLFSLRMTLRSPAGIVLSAAGVLSLIGAIVFSAGKRR
ncbi:MAG: hypothetical protein IKX57_08610 [Oscillospiraceae bacterium]|nr:hypothetical protein [Oscillospiraceae bacterium]